MHLDRWWRSRAPSLHRATAPVTPRNHPQSGLWGVGTLAPEVVLEAHDILEFRDLDHSRVVLEVQAQSSGAHQDRLVLDLVALQGEPLAGLDHEDLADVAVGVGPDQLVTPRLVDTTSGGADDGPLPRPVRH